MSDIITGRFVAAPPQRFKDMGDGTFAAVVAAAGIAVAAGASFNTPAGTTAYSIGDLIADSATAATVNANVTAGAAGIMIVAAARGTDTTGMIRRARLKTADTGAAGATIRVHLYKNRPTVTNGDNGAWLTTEALYIGAIDVTLDKVFSDPFEKGIGVPNAGSEINFEPNAGTQNIYAVLEARSAFTPQGAKAWSLVLEVLQN